MDPYRAPLTETTSTEAAPRIRVLYNAEQISRRVRQLGLEIARDHAGVVPVLVGVLKGASIFQSDLARATPIPLELDFISVSSYGRSLSSSRRARLVADVQTDLSGRHVVLCEGVVDSGHSLSFILDLMRSRRPAGLRVATLLDKKPCREVDVPLDYVGWTVGDDFLVGYGLDAAERHRNLPYVGVLEEA